MLVCLCALCFIFGRFIQEIPGLPDTSKGFRVSKDTKGTSAQHASFRRSVIAVDEATAKAELHEKSKQQAAPVLSAHTFDEALAASKLLQPPVAPGETGNQFYTTQPFQLLSWYPRMYLFPKFLDPERAQHVVKFAKARLAPSALALRKGDTEDAKRDVRTSQGTFISRNEDKEGVLAWIEDKIASLTGLPVAHGEPFNVLRYQLGQHYDSHYDVFEPESYGPQTSQRMATVLFYLTDVEEGGETIFPLEGKDGLQRLNHIDYRKCDMGLKYQPRAGDAVLFYSMHPNGTFDKHALHGGCPVKQGEKWVATKWIRDKCFGHCD